MNAVVWKHALRQGRHGLDLHEGAKVVSVGTDQPQGGFWMWTLEDPDAPKTLRRFVVCGTGEPLDIAVGDLTPVGTVQSGDGLVYHVLEVTG
jgi:hypothetical protein